MPLPAHIPYPLSMDDKVYTTKDGQPLNKIEFDAWVEQFTDNFSNLSAESLSEFWQDAELVPYDQETATQEISLRLSDVELNAIDRKATASGYSRDEFIRIAILLALA